jgi:hypothetical protein
MINHIYHGSPYLISQFELRNHYLANDNPVVFGTPNKTLALTFLSKWKDSDFKQYVKDDVIYMYEQYPNAYEKIYKDKIGYLYELDASTFQREPQLMRLEYMSRVIPRVLSVEQFDVDDILLKEIEKRRIIFIK